MKTVLITGISRGIGKALAEKFSNQGYFVIGTSTSGRTDYSLPNSEIFKLNLGDSKNIEECATNIIDLGKKIDILINNAAIVFDEEMNAKEINIQKFRKTIEVNAIGPLDFTEHLISIINEGGHIVNISSRKGSLELSSKDVDDHGYRVSKTALNMITRILADRLQGKILVSSIHPGWVKTDMGGADAPMETKESAEDIFKFAESKPETGQFWFKQEKLPW